MLDKSTKQRINNARQVLVGIVPNPEAQVQQITTALIYKFMDDMDRENEEIGRKATFLVKDLKNFAWGKLMSRELSGTERLDLYVRALVAFAKSDQIPELFRTIFKDAFLPYRNPEVLDLFLKEIGDFTYDHSENLGNAFEYLLSIMGSQGDAGQFRTPRHIIDFMVEVVNPKKKETILDPACGTAGFLISSYKHIRKQNSSNYNPKTDIPTFAQIDNKEINDLQIQSNGKYKGDKLTPTDRKKMAKNIHGYDIAPEMVRLSKVNMYLHGFHSPQIHEYNSLANEDRWDDQFNVILANPPFMTPKGGIMPHKRFQVQANRSEVLFVDYIAEHLTAKGRAGIIVPEGIIFQTANAYKELRKNLVEDWGLWAVVSLPAGVFQPYSGVKTSVLFLDKEIAKQTKEILFVKVENDGFDLGAQRRKAEKNDLPEAFDVLEKWKDKQKLGKTAIAHTAKKTDITENNDYTLTGNRYKEVIDYSNAKWEMVELGDVLEYEQPTKYIVESTEYKDGYRIPVLTAGKTFILGYTNEDEGIFIENLPVIIFDDFTTATKFVDFPFKVKSSAMKILVANKKMADIRYVFYVMQNIDFKPGEHKRYWISQYSKIKIPLPPLEIQKQIVADLDNYRKVISGAKQVIENWKPTIKIDPKWKIVKLGEKCKTTSGGTPLRTKDEYYEDGDIPWLRSGEVSQGEINKSKLFITKKGLKESSAKVFPKDTVLVAMYGATVGQVGILKFKSSTNQAICGILPSDKFVPEFLFQILRSKKDELIGLAGGGAQPNISQNIIKNLKIPLPSLKIQKQVVEEIKDEQIIVEQNRKMVMFYEKKMERKISEIWGK